MIDKIELLKEDYILTRHKTSLRKQGIETVADMIFKFPIRYENFTVQPLSEAKVDELIVLEGSIISKVSVKYLKTKLSSLHFLFEVEGKVIKATIFNRIFLKNKLDYGTVIRVNGRFYQNLINFTINDLIICDEINRDIIPVYQIKDISESKYLEIFDKVYRLYHHEITESLPINLIQKHHLLDFPTTIKYLHYPDTLADLDEAYRRLKYEEFLEYQLSMKYLHYMREKTGNSLIINYNPEILNKLIDSLPYQLTIDQEKVINEILADLKAPYPMNRLLQGEVGSGKTIVAIVALLVVASSGMQAAFMCPTEILAQQHYVTLKETLKDFPEMKIALLIGSTPLKIRRTILEDLKIGLINIIVGTHTLFQKEVEYDQIGLVIADEEHRFGVRQRVLIKNKGVDVNYLKMSATPIPRSLAISAYGDTDISIIKTMPPNRKKVVTKYVDNKQKRSVITHIKQELKAGHQIYVVTPLINESESLDTANATEIYENMKEYFKGITTVGLIHGRLKGQEKEEIMTKFLNKEIGILVATSVIEVGVNVTNATTIVILGAERFGVATLHQLRGRVMRSDAIPYCFLLTEKKTENSEERLRMVENTTDGFVLAEYDLKHRGPGEFFGEKQSGSMNFKYADIVKDSALLELANNDSELIIKDLAFFNDLEYQKLFKKVHKNYQLKMQELD